jgi:hypothetical protein
MLCLSNSNSCKKYPIILGLGNKSTPILEFLLVRLDSNSPELMPVEHLWEYLPENYFNNRIFKSMSKVVVEEICQGIVNLASNPERWRSMTYFLHLRISYLNAT